MHFKSFGFSDVGKVRKRNEDNYLCNEDDKLFLIADGMGGQVSGEMASRIAIESIEEFVVKSRQKTIPWPIKVRDALTLEQNRLVAAAVYGNKRIKQAVMKNPALRGMGTTLIGGTIENNNFAIVNVGDSRLYRIRNGEITQITEDHSIVAEQKRNGIISEEEAKIHPQKHVLTSALGHINKNPTIDTFLANIKENDLYLICSDGLYNMLEDNEILEIVKSIEDGSLYKMGLSLVLKANLSGGLDNITVILLSFNKA